VAAPSLRPWNLRERRQEEMGFFPWRRSGEVGKRRATAAWALLEVEEREIDS